MANQTNLERVSRTQEQREADVIHEEYTDNWEAQALLDTKNIKARPGYVQRWIRTKVRAEDDQNNIFKKINQGWKPRTLSSIEKGQYVPKIDFQGVDVVGIHGMILMERPEKMHEQQARYNRSIVEHQLSAVKQNVFNVHDARSGLTRPIMKNVSEVSRGRVPDADDD